MAWTIIRTVLTLAKNVPATLVAGGGIQKKIFWSETLHSRKFLETTILDNLKWRNER